MGLFDAFKKKKNQKPAEDIFSTNRSNRVLAEIFRKHNIECEIQGDSIIFEKQQITAATKVFDRTSSAAKVLQIDVKLNIGLGRSIVESCAGFGDDFESALANAWENFLRNSFHVLLGAFFSTEYDDQIHRYQWNINGNTYEVTMSNIGLRGKLPEKLETKWHDQLEEIIQSQKLTHETHWIRLYQAQAAGEVYSCEILLDNDVWTDVESTVQKFDFPQTEKFLSVRVFMVLKSNFDISRTAMIIAWMADAEYDDMQNRLIEQGLSTLDTEKAEVFIPLAFGRAFLKKNIKSTFSDTATIQNDDEKSFEINLNNEKFYTAAYKLAEDILENGCVNYDLFKTLVLQSSEVNAYNNALNEGAKPEDLDDASFGAPSIYLPSYK